MVLTGNPGAGKTTAARLLFRSLRAYGLLQKNVFVERNALELKGTHIGWTCPQVKEMIAAALGGCLFLDEAYALSGGACRRHHHHYRRREIAERSPRDRREIAKRTFDRRRTH